MAFNMLREDLGELWPPVEWLRSSELSLYLGSRIWGKGCINDLFGIGQEVAGPMAGPESFGEKD